MAATWEHLARLVKRAHKSHKDAARSRSKALARLSKSLAALARSGKPCEPDKLPAQKAYNEISGNADKLEAGLAAAIKALEHALPARKARKSKGK